MDKDKISIRDLPLLRGVVLAVESDAVHPLARRIILNGLTEIVSTLTIDYCNLMCCGNCANITMPKCPHWSVGMLTSDYECWQYCDKWETDEMKQADRNISNTQE